MAEIPTFKMNASDVLKDDFQMYLSTNHDLFFRRIIEHVNNRIDNTETEDLMCRILDEEYDETFDLRLPEDGFIRSLNKALDYFTFIEEYETCQFINDLKKTNLTMWYYPKDEEFKRFANSEGISSGKLDYYNKQIENSMTPYILEERQLRATQMDIFSRLMMDRLLWVAGPVNDNMSTIVQAQLMFLSNSSTEDITMHIDSPGGSVKSGLSMVDVMDYIGNDIRTINTGMAASMGSVLLGAGTKGKRMSLRFSRTMLHQSSGGAGGNIQDARIQFDEWEKVNKILFELLGEYCGKDADQVKKDAERDLWLGAKEALDYGIIDEIVTTSGGSKPW